MCACVCLSYGLYLSSIEEGRMGMVFGNEYIFSVVLPLVTVVARSKGIDVDMRTRTCTIINSIIGLIF